MQKIIPVYYSEYGRYITRFRAIPFHIDCLKPVERRILLTLHEVARTKLTKSAKVVGYCIGNLHPHGDQSCYGTLVNLVQQKFAIGQGNWGSPGLIDAEASSYRYTECRLSDWVEELAFKYIDFVPWENFELEKEPLYLPSPVPLGLIGEGVITGISFYRTLIPKYKLKDLLTRLIWLIENQKISIQQDLADDHKMDSKTYGPEIQPNIKNCQIHEDSLNQFYSLLFHGTGSINIIPNGKIENNSIKILGRAPNSTFNSLEKDKDELNIYLNCLSKDSVNIEVIPKKRGIDLTELGNRIWKDYLNKKFNFDCILCNEEGMAVTIGIDMLISNSYLAWARAVLLKNIDAYERLCNKKFEILGVQIIRYIIEITKANKISQIVDKFNELCQTKSMLIEMEEYDLENRNWIKKTKNITKEDIEEICSKKSIKNLVETEIDFKQVEKDILSAKSSIDHVDVECYKYVKELQQKAKF